MTGVGVRVAVVPAAATYALRQQVLRPHQSVAAMALAGDENPTTIHLATLDDSGQAVGVLRLQPAACPWRPERPDAWQLRGMAVAEHLRGRQLGAALVAAAVAHVAEQGGGLLWCNARVPAEAFYARAGFIAVDDRWDDPDIGPHVGMIRDIPSDGAARQ